LDNNIGYTGNPFGIPNGGAAKFVYEHINLQKKVIGVSSQKIGEKSKSPIT